MMKSEMHTNHPSCFKQTGLFFLRGLLHTGCRKQAFKHALLDAGTVDSASTEQVIEQNFEEVRKS